MLDETYSRDAFEAAGLDSSEAQRLADSLADEIVVELDAVVRNRFLQIVQRLNEMGHELKPYVPLVPGEYSFRDDSGAEETGTYSCRLRVALDYVVSAGFAHLQSESS